MAKAWLCFAGVWVVVLIGGVQARAQESATSAQAATKKVCKVISSPPTPAETALNRKDYSLAESLFRALLTKSPTDETAHEGLVRALIEQDKVSDAAHEAEAWSAASPESSVAMDALAEVRVRQGDPTGGFALFQKALRTDMCDARAYYGVANLDRLVGRHATSKRLIEQAHALHPTDDEIYSAWMWTRPRKERLDLWTAYAEHSDQISDEDRASLKTRLAKDSLYHPSDCRMSATSPHEAKVPMVPVMDGPSRFVAWGLDVQFNGKRRRLEIDTGASGITISKAAAMFMGITREDVTSVGGIGDKGSVRTSVAHVASIKIGGMEFTNCPVEILEKFSLLDSDGLIGGDVFEDSQLTLDFPKQQLRVSPLPEPPGDKKPATGLNTAGEDEDIPAHDPYIAPEMAKWERIYRAGHQLLIPGGIVETKRVKDDKAWKDTIFLLDTGAESNLISPAAARSVTKVSRDDSINIRGISGQVEKVFEAGKFTLAFSGLRLDSPRMTAIDTTKISHSAGMEVSGLIGAPALTLLALHIDYRDNLIWCEYSPPK